jgi:sec-independent protein translocase protein TatC
MTDNNLEEENVENSKAPLVSHLIELRDRLKWAVIAFFIAFLISYFFADYIYGFLVKPLKLTYQDMGYENPRMIYTGLTEAFFTYLKVSFYTALFISFPVIASQIYKFAAPGLYKNEKRAFYPFLIATPVLFSLGAALVYYFIFPLAWKFFLGFQTTGIETGLAIELEAKVNEYLSLVLKLMFAFGLAFQLPVAVSLLARAGLVTSKGMREKRKYAFVGAFATAALLTPPDLISQVGLGIPIIILYEISIRLASIMERKRSANDDSDDPDDTDNSSTKKSSKDIDIDDIEDIPETDYTED